MSICARLVHPQGPKSGKKGKINYGIITLTFLCDSVPIPISDISRVFLSRLIHYSKPQWCQHVWFWEKESEFVPPNILKLYFLALSVLRFICKRFSKLLKFTLQNILKKLKNLNGYKILRAAKQSELKICSK